MKHLKVAIVHDWLIGGGAEQVVYELHKMFPDAPIYTSYCTNEWRFKFNGKVVTGFLQYWPFSKFRKLLPILRIWWFSNLKLAGYDLVISSSGAEAKGIKVSTGTIHINYCHAPTHYYWSRYDDYLHNPGLGVFSPLAKLGLRLLIEPLRKWDYKAAQRPDFMLANSAHTQAAIKKYYNRDSHIIAPPIDTEYFRPTKNQKRSGFVITGRHVHYKRIDLAVKACTQLGLPLKVVGDGPELENLKKLAGPTIHFYGKVSRNELRTLLQTSEAFIFPGLDDFGLAAVEALATGTPVIAYKAGGALDYVMEGKTGRFFNEQSVDSLSQCLKNFNPRDYSVDDIKSVAQRYSKEFFTKNMQKEITDKLQ